MPLFKSIKENTAFRKVLFTHKYSQVEIMNIEENEDTGMEKHEGDQILVFISGKGVAIVGSEEKEVGPGDVLVVPAKTPHNIANVGDQPLKLFTFHSPPEHKSDTSHSTKLAAVMDPYESRHLET
jgi:mannose-6-phosphate isomerase-like protein (cupin superfamily)